MDLCGPWNGCLELCFYGVEQLTGMFTFALPSIPSRAKIYHLQLNRILTAKTVDIGPKEQIDGTGQLRNALRHSKGDARMSRSGRTHTETQMFLTDNLRPKNF